MPTDVTANASRACELRGWPLRRGQLDPARHDRAARLPELRERPLLDAAHIVPDRLPEGVATVTNGLAMCPTHHRAYDQDVLLVSEAYRVEVRRARLDHVDSAPTVKMLLDFDGKTIWLPKDEALRPAPEFLRRKIKLVA